MAESDRRTRILRQHLKTEHLLGVEAVPAGRPQPQGGAEATSRDPVEAPADSSAIGGGVGEASALGTDAKIERLERLDREHVRPCTRCDLCKSRTQTVFGEGDVDARLMFVGEGPGQREDELGRPFVGRAGELLDKQIAAMGLSRQDVYIANIVKCRPPDNRTPTPDEVEACTPHLNEQIMAIRPTVIVSLGAPAAKVLLKTREGIGKLRGMWHQYEGLLPDGPAIAVMPTFHPAFLLRQYTTENRKKVWSDLQKAMERLAQER